MEDGKGVQNLFGPALIRILSGLDWRDVANAAMVNKVTLLGFHRHSMQIVVAKGWHVAWIDNHDRYM